MSMPPLRIPERHIANAYLLEGNVPERLYEAARHFAAHLLAQGQNPPKSLELRMERQSHPDFLLIRPDKPEDRPHIISVDNIRRNLADTVGIRPYEAAYKVYAILHAEQMNAQAQNALLKTLEEPPPYVVILLLSANADAFLPTILSRVIEIKDREQDAGARFQALCGTAWAETCLSLLSAGAHCSRKEIFSFSKELSEQKVPLEDFLSFLEILLRDILCYKYTGDSGLLFGKSCAEQIAGLSARMDSQKLGKLTDMLSEAYRGIPLNVNQELQVEHLLLACRG